ncbi:MAG: FMN-binding protein [Planctomycetota bacterium]|nr:FMN-binding protein [Planctomycetota bacterium]
MVSAALPTLLFGLTLLGTPAAPTADPGEGTGKVFLTVGEALKLAFPKCEIERSTVFLTKDQKRRVEKLAKVDLATRIVFPYVAKRDGKVVGTAWFDTHRVRTLNETVMFVVDPNQRIQRFELLSFAEPQDYIPRGNWYDQLKGRKLDAELNLKRGIKGVTGATLTAKATVKAARRTLALQAVLFPPPKRGE